MARRQCSKSEPSLEGDPGLEVGFRCVRGEQRRLEERHRLLQHARVAGGTDVVGDRVGQPEQVVGAARARAAAARLVPPVLDVAFEELPAGGSQQVLPEEIGPGEGQGHDVLKLVAEAEGAARLVVGGAGPQPAAHVLIEQPAVHQEVEGVVGGADLDGVEDDVPALAHGSEGGFCRGYAAMTAHEHAGLVHILALSEEERETARLSGLQGEGDVQGGAGIEPRAEAARQPLTAESRRLRQRAVAAEERQAVARRRAQGLARVREGHAPRERLVVGVPGQDGPALVVELGHHVRVLAGSRRPQHPLVVGEDAQAARPVALVREREQRELHRVLRVHEDVELVPHAVRDAREAGEAGGMPDQEAPVRCRTGGASGPGVGDHASPVSSSRTKSASPVGSVTGSFANGVRRFSRLFSDQV